MAVYNEILAGRFNRALQKLTSIKGSPPVRTLGSEILPVFPLFWGCENRYLESWDRFGSFIAQSAGGAGTFASIRYRNPSGSNVIAVIEKLTWVNLDAVSDTVNLIVGPDPGQLATGVGLTANRWDPRGRPQPTLLASRGIPNSSTSVQYAAFCLAGQNLEIIVTDIQEIPLLPGDALTISNGVAANNAAAVTWWRERFLEDSERT